MPRAKLLSSKQHRQEQELRILSNPFGRTRSTLLDTNDDYQAPLTTQSLRAQSKWIIVRNNLHKIRSWGGLRRLSNVDPRCQDWYVFFQMRRELRRAQMDISTIQSRADYAPLRYFQLPVDPTHVQRYDVSHLRPKDAIYYPSLGNEPLVLQSLLFYFTKECAVPYNSMFRSFLTDVCSIINRDRQRLNRAAVLRRVALTLTVVVFLLVALMFFTMIFSLLTTTSNLTRLYQHDSDGGLDWHPTTTTFEVTLNSV